MSFLQTLRSISIACINPVAVRTNHRLVFPLQGEQRPPAASLPVVRNFVFLDCDFGGINSVSYHAIAVWLIVIAVCVLYCVLGWRVCPVLVEESNQRASRPLRAHVEPTAPVYLCAIVDCASVGG